jgi:hypothetical protein
MHKLLAKTPLLRRLGFRDWGGTGFIYIENGTVQDYSFWITYQTSRGQWRGFRAEEGKALPENRPCRRAFPTRIPSNAMTYAWVKERATWVLSSNRH